MCAIVVQFMILCRGQRTAQGTWQKRGKINELDETRSQDTFFNYVRSKFDEIVFNSIFKRGSLPMTMLSSIFTVLPCHSAMTINIEKEQPISATKNRYKSSENHNLQGADLAPARLHPSENAPAPAPASRDVTRQKCTWRHLEGHVHIGDLAESRQMFFATAIYVVSCVNGSIRVSMWPITAAVEILFSFAATVQKNQAFAPPGKRS